MAEITKEIEEQFADWLRGYDSDHSATPNQVAMKLAKFAVKLVGDTMTVPSEYELLEWAYEGDENYPDESEVQPHGKQEYLLQIAKAIRSHLLKT